MNDGEPSTLSLKMERAVNIALSNTHKSTHHIFKHCTVIMNRSGIISLAVNHNHRTARMPNKLYGISDKPHAEMRALKYAGVKAKGSTLISIRAGLLKSKPCDGCMEEIRKAGIKKIVYSDGKQMIMEKVK